MPTVIMPKMGDAMEEGTLLKWLKNTGDTVAQGEPIAEIETDKVTLEIEAEADGTLTEQIASEGESVPVGKPIALILGEGETAESPRATQEVEAQPTEESAARATEQAGQEPAAAAPTRGDADGAVVDALRQAEPAAQPAPQPAAQPAPQPVAATNGQTVVRTSGANGQASAPASRAPGERLRASPLVKRLAAEHGIDLQNVTGSGPGGRIVKDDITPFLTGAAPMSTAPAAPVDAPASAPAAAAQPAVAVPATAAGRPAGVPREMSRIRRTTGRRMSESKQVVPHFYVTSEIDMAAAVAFREQVNAQVEDEATKVSFNDLIVKAAALGLREFPSLNASFEGDQIVDHPNVDVNIAVAIEGGLIAPFVPDADQKSLGTIARMAKDLIGRARNGGLTPEEFQGGTFTVSNLGMFDVEEFIAIINPPQAAILAVGSIKELPVVTDGKVTIGRRMNITLSADHRVTDGVEVARFLQRVKGYLQNPMLLALS